MTTNNHESQDHIPTTPLSDEQLPSEAVTASDGINAQAPAASESAMTASASAPAPFFKRKWVLITAPIVAGMLLLGIGGGVGYAVGDDDRGGRHMSDSGQQFGGRGSGEGPRGKGGGFDNGQSNPGQGGPGGGQGDFGPDAPEFFGEGAPNSDQNSNGDGNTSRDNDQNSTEREGTDSDTNAGSGSNSDDARQGSTNS